MTRQSGDNEKFATITSALPVGIWGTRIALSLLGVVCLGIASTAQVSSPRAPFETAFNLPANTAFASLPAPAPSPEPVTGVEFAPATQPRSYTECKLAYRLPLVQPKPGLPDAPSVEVYRPLSSHCKFELFLHQSFARSTFAEASFDATWDQMFGQWPEYGGGMRGWGQRLGASYADMESRRFIQGYVLSSVLHQDPRYFYSGKQKLVPRAWYAATRVFITKGDNGKSEFNTSEVLGALFSSSLQNAYYPSNYRSFGDTMARFVGAFGSDATSNLLREFTPDLKRFFNRHAPHQVLAIEHKLPFHNDGAMQ